MPNATAAAGAPVDDAAVPGGVAGPGGAGASPLLTVEDLRTELTVEGGRRLTAVDGVSFDLDRASFLGIVGESGSGKTMLIRSIMGLLPPKGTRRTGTVRFAGRVLTDIAPKALRGIWGKEIAMIFQDPMTALNPVVRAGRQITEAIRAHLDVDREEALQLAQALLHDVGIPEADRRLRWYPHQFSGGQRQRVLIAIALACGPRLLLADEPTTGLDVTLQAEILDLLDREREEREMAVILVTHDLASVAGRTDRVLVMYAGRIVEAAATRTLFARPAMPYTEALLASVPRIEHPAHTRLDAIPGRPPQMLELPAGCAFAPRCRYAQPICREEAPALRPLQDDPAHLVACHFPVGRAATPTAGTAAAPAAPAPTAATAGTAAAPADRSAASQEVGGDDA